jgi:hypothetical protein
MSFDRHAGGTMRPRLAAQRAGIQAAALRRRGRLIRLRQERAATLDLCERCGHS